MEIIFGITSKSNEASKSMKALIQITTPVVFNESYLAQIDRVKIIKYAINIFNYIVSFLHMHNFVFTVQYI